MSSEMKRSLRAPDIDLAPVKRDEGSIVSTQSSPTKTVDKTAKQFAKMMRDERELSDDEIQMPPPLRRQIARRLLPQSSTTSLIQHKKTSFLKSQSSRRTSPVRRTPTPAKKLSPQKHRRHNTLVTDISHLSEKLREEFRRNGMLRKALEESKRLEAIQRQRSQQLEEQLLASERRLHIAVGQSGRQMRIVGSPSHNQFDPDTSRRSLRRIASIAPNKHCHRSNRFAGKSGNKKNTRANLHNCMGELASSTFLGLGGYQTDDEKSLGRNGRFCDDESRHDGGCGDFTLESGSMYTIVLDAEEAAPAAEAEL